MIGVLAVLAFLFVLQVSVAGAFRTAMPQLAVAWMPSDSEARSRLASALIERGSPQTRETARRLALEAIRRDPISPVALRVLAQSGGSNSNAQDKQVADLMLEAERLTRRDRAAQLWFVQYYIQRGDIAQVMRHFDIALRTSERGRAMVFPLLAAAASEPSLARALVARLRERPVWAVPFMVYLIDEGADSARTVTLARAVLNPADERDLGLIRSLLQRLGSRDEPALAWDVYSHFGLAKNAPGRFIQGGDFESAAGIDPFAWILLQDTDLWAARQPAPAGDGNVLQLGAASEKSGEVARQLIRLNPGRYRLEARMGAIPQAERARPRIEIRCAGGARTRPLSTLVAAQGGPQARRLNASFAIPTGCGFQWLSIHAVGETMAPSEYPWADDISVTPLAQ